VAHEIVNLRLATVYNQAGGLDVAARAGEDLLVEREAAARRRQTDEVRSEVTAIIQRAVEDSGRKVSDDKLNRPLYHIEIRDCQSVTHEALCLLYIRTHSVLHDEHTL